MTTPQITLSKATNILNGIVCHEFIDIEILDKLINSDLLKTTFHNPVCSEIYSNEKAQLLKYKELIRNGKSARVEYKRTKGNPFGRCNPIHGLGLFNIRRELRQTLAKRRYTDIDIKNAHPDILYQIIDKNGFKTKYLRDCIEDRPKWFNEITRIYGCTEEAAKTLMIRYLYGGGIQGWFKDNNIDPEANSESEMLKSFHTEVGAFQLRITENNPNIKKIAEKIKEDSDIVKYNINGTTTSYFLQEYEVRILEQLYIYCRDNNLTPNDSVVLCADGLMIETEFYTDELLTIFHNIIEEKFGLSLTFVKKEMKQDYLGILDEHVKEPTETDKAKDEEEKENKSFKKMATEFEKNHAKIVNKASFVKIKDDGGIEFFTKQGLMTAYEHMNCGGKSYVSFIKKWLQSPNMRKYDDVGIYPDESKCPPNIFNMWRPFRVNMLDTDKYVKNEEALQLILQQIRILSNHEEAIYDYFVRWIANAYLYPQHKSTCIVLISEEGAGKTWLLTLLQRLFGEEKLLITNTPARDVWGNFNAQMVSKYIVNLNELSKRDTVDSEEKIKGLITDDQLTINGKGTNQIVIKSYHHFIVTTNKEDGGINTLKGDRRKAFVRSSDEKCEKNDENAAYFRNLFALLDDDNAVLTFAEFLQNLENVPPNFLNYPIPVTEYQKELQSASRQSHDLWLEDFARTHNHDVVMTSGQVFESFKKWCDKSGFKYDGVNVVKLCLKLKHLFKQNDSEKYIKTLKTRECNKKQFIINELRDFYKIECALNNDDDTTAEEEKGDDNDSVDEKLRESEIIYESNKEIPEDVRNEMVEKEISRIAKAEAAAAKRRFFIKRKA